MSGPTEQTRASVLVATIAAIAFGAATWLYVAHISNRREAWDSEMYFTTALPCLALVVTALGFFVPTRPWRWAFLPFAGQAAVAVVQNPTANLLPAGLMVFGFFGAVCMVPAYAGAWMRRVTRR